MTDRPKNMRPTIWAALLLALAAPQAAASQIAEVVDRVGDGIVRFSYDVQDDVEICDQGIRIGDRQMQWRSGGWDEEPTNCRIGFAEVELRVADGLVRDVDLMLSVDDRSEGVEDLGRVSAEEASGYLLSLPRGGATERGAEEAIFPAMLADVDEIWRQLVDLASDRGLSEDVRTSALFWLSQEATDAVTETLAQVALRDDEDQEIRDAAVFALSQRPEEEGVPVLMEVAQTADQAATRRSAMFWLGQSDDDRVVAFFEEILLGSVR